MIAEITGTVRALAPDAAVVAVAGVGLQVHATPATLARLRVGQSTTLATALVVREDSLTLYGFVDADERAVFETLQTATGVGPRLAQAVLGVLNPEAVRAAIADEDLAALTAVPGIGRKVAQRLVLELKDRLGPPQRADASPLGGAGGASDAGDLRAGLLALGYSLREADAAVSAVRAGGAVPTDASTSDVLRAALTVLRRS